MNDQEESENTSSWTDCESVTENDISLINLVRGYSHRYNKNSKDHKDKNMRDRSWEEIGSILKCSGMSNYIDLKCLKCIYRNKCMNLFTAEECEKRWVRLRERFSRERRLRDAETRSGSTTTAVVLR